MPWQSVCQFAQTSVWLWAEGTELAKALLTSASASAAAMERWLEDGSGWPSAETMGAASAKQSGRSSAKRLAMMGRILRRGQLPAHYFRLRYHPRRLYASASFRATSMKPCHQSSVRASWEEGRTNPGLRYDTPTRCWIRRVQSVLQSRTSAQNQARQTLRHNTRAMRARLPSSSMLIHGSRIRAVHPMQVAHREWMRSLRPSTCQPQPMARQAEMPTSFGRYCRPRQHWSRCR